MEVIERRFQKLFEGLDRVHGYYEIDPDLSSRQTKVTGKAVTIKEKVQDEHWSKHLEGTLGLGIVPIRDDQCCVFAALDIDEYDLDLKKLNKEIYQLKFPFVLCRTKSGGAHLFVFFTEPVRAKVVRMKLAKMADALGYPSVEIFPKQKEMKPGDVGNWINLPYFNLPGPTNRYALDANGKALQMLEQFVAFAESRKISKDEFLDLKIKKIQKPFMDGPPCLQRLASNGFPQGTRNNSLFNIGVYLRMKYPDEWQDKLESYNRELMSPPLKAAEVLQTQKSLNRDKYFYKCNDEPICQVCSKSSCMGRKYGIGHGDDPSELEGMLGTLQKTVLLDLYGDPVLDEKPEWYMDVDGVQITLKTPELFDQNKFIMKLSETLLKYPRRVNTRRWQEILKEKIETATTVEVPPETGTYGKIVEALQYFAERHGGATSRKEIEDGMVWEEDGYLYWKPQSFWNYLVRKNIYHMKDDGKPLNRILKNMGATRKQLMLDSKSNLNRMVWKMRDWREDKKEQSVEPRRSEAEF